MLELNSLRNDLSFASTTAGINILLKDIEKKFYYTLIHVLVIKEVCRN